MRIEYQLTLEEYKEGSRGQYRGTRRIMLGLIGVAVFVNALAFAPRLLYCSTCPIAQAATPLQEYAPWIVIFLAIWLITFSMMRSGASGEWQRRPALRLPKAAEFLPDRVYVVDSVTRTEYLWAAIGQVIETPNTFAFMIDHAPAFIVPKRALGSTETIGAFRSLLLSAMPGRLRLV
jgi:hypothetical protein